jgi:VWFA-related protein
MNLRIVTAIVLVMLLSRPLPAQQEQAPGVIRIEVNLVQVDAVVTDSKGKPVTDLTADDFEVYQDGRLQRIRNFEFVRVRAGEPGGSPVPGPRVQPRGTTPPPSRALRPEEVRRTIALVVDDWGMSFDSIVHSREAMRKWVDTEMQPGDLISLTRTYSAMGAIQTFTTDKRELYSAIDRVKYQPARIGVESFSRLGGAGNPASDQGYSGELLNAYLTQSINAIRYVTRGLRELPGRKSVILFAEDLPLNSLDSQRQLLEDRLRDIADEANRSSVVIHAIDPRGVAYIGPTVTDQLAGGVGSANALAERSYAYIRSQDGMVLLSHRTGGAFHANSNDIGALLKQAVDDGDGYYLMGYSPSLGTFDPSPGSKPRFHTISVRVKRPGLTVRSRTGFFGAPDQSIPQFSTTRTGQLAKALVSPFTTPDLRVRLTALFTHSDKDGPYLKTMLHFDARDLTFTERPDGSRTAQIDVGMVTIDQDGVTRDAVDKTWDIKVEKDSFENVLKQGLVYSVPLPIKKPGPYQLRVALRDAKSTKLGSAMQFIEVPDVKSGRMALSGIILSSDSSSSEDLRGTPAVRVFRPGETFSYAYEILNARKKPQDNPKLEMQTRIFRENEVVYTSMPALLNTESDKGATRLAVGGKTQLTRIPPGEYVMQVTVSEAGSRDKSRTAVQAIEFEIR